MNQKTCVINDSLFLITLDGKTPRIYDISESAARSINLYIKGVGQIFIGYWTKRWRGYAI